MLYSVVAIHFRYGTSVLVVWWCEYNNDCLMKKKFNKKVED